MEESDGSAVESSPPGEPAKRWWVRKSLDWVVPVLVGGVLTLGSSIVTSNIQGDRSAELQREALAQDRDLQLRNLRRPIYLDYLRKSSVWVEAQKDRIATCKRKSDEPLREGGVCSAGYLTTLQSARYDLRGAQNQMSTVESRTMLKLRGLFETSFPSASPTDTGPHEGKPQDYFGDAYSIMLDLTTCDTNPNPDVSECKKTIAQLEKLVREAGLS